MSIVYLLNESQIYMKMLFNQIYLYYFIPMDLEKEIKNLKEKYKELSKENRRLILENADLMWERDGLKRVVEKLHKEIETLELWLDNKEKLNEEYRKQIDKLKEKYGDLDY